jgi:hypothetical protein
MMSDKVKWKTHVRTRHAVSAHVNNLLRSGRAKARPYNLSRRLIASLAFVLLTALLSVSMVIAQDDNVTDELVNLDHLKFLTQPVTIADQDMALVHIYSEYPEYEWVDAAGEGLSAVDDVARAAVVYLWEYERTGDEELLDLAKRCLNFVVYMQAEDGEFYNFVTNQEGTINERGGTSFKSLGWWAMRGLWSLGEGIRVFDSIDPEYADELEVAYLKTEAALGETLGSYGQYTKLHGFQIPSWIPGAEPAVASIGVLGLSAYYTARPNDTTADILTKIADGISEYRLGDHTTYPFGMHPARANAPGFWHAWGGHMTHALAVAGMALDRQDWLDSAAADADSFLLRQIAFERFRHIGVVPYRLEQIAYGTNQVLLAYTALYQATGEERYARYAGLMGSWYFGNNMAGVQMYDPETGRVLDGINGPVAYRVNRNSGAESTIEGLMSMIALADVPEAQPLLQAKAVEGNGYIILEAEAGERVVGTPAYTSLTWTGEGYISGGRFVSLGEGQRMRILFEATPDQASEDYWFYIAHQRQAMSSSQNLVNRTETAPEIDGSASGWPEDVPVLASNSARQFLRGAGLWQGEDVDSHAIRLLWDDDNLYILADVRDPEHNQPFTLSNAGSADNLWIYVTNSPTANRLSAKFTLAETPEGPQVWDWVGSGFLDGAQLAWQAAEDGAGYTYEASIPWSSLDVDAPTAGITIGFEAGRGVGGNSFMDLTGRDPDVPSNLLELTLTAPDAQIATDAPEVALEVRLNDLDGVDVPQTISPDTDYFWLDLVQSEPVQLVEGENTIRYRYAGAESENPGLSKVDAFYLQPVVARRVFELPDGTRYTLTYDTSTGEVTWE